jgi:UDP-glucose 4-epimerase
MGSFVSVLQIIEAVSKEVGQAVRFHPLPVRSGVPAYTVSDISKAQKVLGWTPVASSLTNIVGFVISSCKVKPRA